MKPKSFPAITLFLGFLSYATTSWAFLPSAQAVLDNKNSNYDFNGIVALSNCSGSIVRFEDSQDQDPAMILSNGHCVKLIPAGTSIINQESKRRFWVLDDRGKYKGSIRATNLMYATMTKTDIALYKLTDTYEEIKNKFSVTPLTLASEAAHQGDQIEIISGYWRRGYTCEIETFVHSLKEASWTFIDSIRYSRPGCETIGGTSGSPVILAGSRTVVGVNNTGNEDGEECTLNNPCEVDADGNIEYEQGRSYAQQTSWLYSCRNINGELDIGTEGCLLPSNPKMTA